MSTGMRWRASIEHKAMATTATSIVTGRRRADRTSHIEDEFQCSPSGSYKMIHMRDIASFLLVCACCMAQTPPPVAVPDSSAPEANASADAAIRQIVARYVDARDNKDAKATAALFTADADQLVSSGEWRKGRDALVRGAMASSEASGGKRTITVETVRFLSPDVAIADGRYQIAGPQPRHMWAAIIMKRTPEGWRIAAIRNMLPAAPAAPK